MLGVTLVPGSPRQRELLVLPVIARVQRRDQVAQGAELCGAGC